MIGPFRPHLEAVRKISRIGNPITGESNMNPLLRPFLIIALLSTAVFGRGSGPQWPGTFFSGYDKTLHGGGFVYHSPQPDVTSSMLIRSLVSSDYIEWTTASVPTSFTGQYADFVWMFGIDANNGRHEFTLFVNGTDVLTFSNPTSSSKREWTIDGKDGTQLVFIPTLVDQYNDLMGYAVLRIRREMIIAGKEQDIKITGENAGSRAWYMTFESPVEERMSGKQIEAELRQDGKTRDEINLEFVHLGNTTTADVEIPGEEKQRLTIQPGYNSFDVEIPAVASAGKITAAVTIDGKTDDETINVSPVKHWTVYMVEHTHTDIGYTRPQNEILAAHLRYIDEALDYCDETDSLPPDARFHWTCETAWAVREYLRTRPQSQIERLLRRIKERRIEVTGLFLNMSDMYDEPTLENLLETVKEFKDSGIDVRTGMQDDVNGAAWCLPDLLSSAGIKYFTMGQNVDRAMEPFKRPTAFWWESPDGSRILAYRGEHYMYGDMLGILSGDMKSFSGNLFRYLSQLQSEGYPFDGTMVQFLGYFTDNAPPSTKACGMVEEWNREFEWPKIKLVTISQYFDYIAKYHSSDLQTYRLAWPDWWIDGFGSAENETAHVRDVQSSFITNQGLLSMAEITGVRPKPAVIDKLSSINESIAFYDEHSFGAAESISDPLSVNSTVQWNEKRAFAWDAFRKNGLLTEEALGLLASPSSREDEPTLTVYNTMSFPRSGICDLFVFNNIIPYGKDFKLVDSNGNPAPAQLLDRRAEGNYWAIFAKDVPAFGYKTYKIEASDSPAMQYESSDFHGTIANSYYRLTIDTARGSIGSIVDKSTGDELVDSSSSWGLGEFIYETLPDREEIPRHEVDQYTRLSWKNVSIGSVVHGPIWTGIDLNGQIPGCADSSGINCEIRLYNYEKRIELVYSMKKEEVFTPEGVYVAFPFRIPEGEISFEVQGGTVVPGKGQLPGTASDWDGVQNFASVKNGSTQIVLSSPEIPIMEFGGINLGKFQEVSSYSKPYIFSWVLNNYWTTNFPVMQEGGMEWRYELTSSGDTSEAFATRFGWSSRVPLAAIASENCPASGIGMRSILNFKQDDPMLVYARPAWSGDGVILCMREIEGRNARLDLSEILRSYPKKSAFEVNSLEEPSGKSVNEISFEPDQVKFILVR